MGNVTLSSIHQALESPDKLANSEEFLRKRRVFVDAPGHVSEKERKVAELLEQQKCTISACAPFHD